METTEAQQLAELVAAAQDGDVVAFSTLYRRHVHDVRRAACGVLHNPRAA